MVNEIRVKASIKCLTCYLSVTEHEGGGGLLIMDTDIQQDKITGVGVKKYPHILQTGLECVGIDQGRLMFKSSNEINPVQMGL